MCEIGYLFVVSRVLRSSGVPLMEVIPHFGIYVKYPVTLQRGVPSMKVTDCGHFIFPGPNFVSPEWKCSLVSQRRGSNVIWDRYLDKESHSWGWDISTSSFVNIIKAFLLSLKLDKRVSVFMSFQGCGQARIKRSIKLLVLLGSYFYGSFDWGTFVFEIRWNLFFRKSIPQLFFAWKDSLVARDNSQWPLCVITSVEQISPPRPRLPAKFFPFALFVRGYSFQQYCLGNSFI